MASRRYDLRGAADSAAPDQQAQEGQGSDARGDEIRGQDVGRGSSTSATDSTYGPTIAEQALLRISQILEEGVAIPGRATGSTVRTELPKIVKSARDLGCRSFSGTEGPEAADEWLLAMEGAIDSMQMDTATLLSVVGQLLVDSARHWWTGLVRMSGRPTSWDEFRKHFEDRFFTRHHRQRKAREFMELRQGRMTVTEYELQFSSLIRYSDYHLTQEEARISHFLQGLNQEIREQIMALPELSYRTIVQMAMEAEDVLEMGRRLQQGAYTRSGGGAHQHFSLKRSGGQQGKGKQPVRQQGPKRARTGDGQQSQQSEGGRRQEGVTCFRCGRQGHIARDCSQQGGRRAQGSGGQRPVTCFRCQQPGHISMYCPQKPGGSVVQSTAQGGRQGQQRGGSVASAARTGAGAQDQPVVRAYHLAQEDIQRDDHVVTGE